MPSHKSDPRRAANATRAKVDAGQADHHEDTSRPSVVPFGIAAARATDRARQARGETSWTRPALPGEWDVTVPPGAPPVTVMVEVSVLGPGVRSRRPAYLIPAEVPG
jgi:hypothetical protein